MTEPDETAPPPRPQDEREAFDEQAGDDVDVANEHDSVLTVPDERLDERSESDAR
jgi:hypothetical protein